MYTYLCGIINAVPGKIKKQDVFIQLNSYVSHLMLENNIIDPCEVDVSLKEFALYLNKKLDTHLESVQHMYQQIRAFERSNNCRIFMRKEVSDKNDIVLRFETCDTYEKKLFLHIGLKMVLSNGALELCNELYELEKKRRAINVYLSAGTESYYLAELFFEKYKEELNIYTHNLGILQNYAQHYKHLSNIHVFSRFAMVHRDSFTLLENQDDNYKNVKFDFVIGSTSYVDKHKLSIESKLESEYKYKIYKMFKGTKVLLLSMFEFDIPKDIKIYEYAKVEDFDYIIIVSEKFIPSKVRGKLDIYPFESIIKSYSYEVLKKTNK